MSEKREMLVTEGLNQLKILKNRIDRKIMESDHVFVTGSKKSSENVAPGLSKENFIKNAKASYDSILDLIEEREKIKRAIVASNAITEVEIGNEKMTVAEAIDKKETIKFKKDLLISLKEDLADAEMFVNQHNATMERKIDEMFGASSGDDKKKKTEEYEMFSSSYKKMNEADLVDPLNIKQKIEDLEKYIEDFEGDVDSKLQISNCRTFITIE